MARFGLAPRVSAVDGRFARHGGHDGVHQAAACRKLSLTSASRSRSIPGVPMFYATAFTLSGYANPLLVESHLGRPTKIEGNSLHPASLGGTDIFAQASILGMYDPDRSQAITHLGDVAFVGGVREGDPRALSPCRRHWRARAFAFSRRLSLRQH